MNTSLPIYILSGLGADERAFGRLDLSGLDIRFIPWLPVHKKEPLSEYVSRLAEGIKEGEIVIIGLSFGGMVAQEIAKIKKCRKLILISSFKGPWELPFYYRLALGLRMQRILPLFAMGKVSKLTKWFFGARTKEDTALLNRIIADTNSEFLLWALEQIRSWKGNKQFPVYAIHGSNDRIIPSKSVRVDHCIEGGGHFMVWTRAQEISEVLKKDATVLTG